MKNVIKKNFNVFIYKKNGCMFGTELFTRSKLCKQSSLKCHHLQIGETLVDRCYFRVKNELIEPFDLLFDLHLILQAAIVID